MDFEKEAREIAYGFWCGNCEGPSARPCKKHEGCYELIIEIKEALLRAHRQGQEEMRERADLMCKVDANSWEQNGEHEKAYACRVTGKNIRQMILNSIEEQ